MPYLTLHYITGKACYTLVLRPPVGPTRVPKLTLRLRKPLGAFSKLQERAPMLCLNSLGTKRWFPNCFLRFPTRALNFAHSQSKNVKFFTYSYYTGFCNSSVQNI